MPQSFDCKEPDCDSKVIYEPISLDVYREGKRPQEARPSGGMKRVYLSCSRNHSHDYVVRA
jgi:hypothetical protein